MLNIHRCKIVFSFLLILFSATTLFAQSQQMKKGRILGKNLPGYDDRKMHYGFYLGAVTTRLNVEHSQSYVDSLSLGGAVTRVNPKYTPGFTLGFVISRHLGDYFDLRFVPGVGFFSRNIEFENKGELKDQEVAATTISLPFLLKYSSKRRKNSRMYFVAGVSPTIDVGGSKRSERIDNQLRLDKNNFQIEYGAGLDLFYPFFKFAPEIRVAHGMPNLLIPDNNAFARSLNKVTTTNITLYLFFE
jgi:hypothetical protein